MNFFKGEMYYYAKLCCQANFPLYQNFILVGGGGGGGRGLKVFQG